MRAALRSAVRGENRDSSANQRRSARIGSGTGRSVVLFLAVEEPLGDTAERDGGEGLELCVSTSGCRDHRFEGGDRARLRVGIPEESGRVVVAQHDAVELERKEVWVDVGPKVSR